ncbi:N-acetylmuramoyl-L-alanine amidase [Rossellomorea aquimaris]|uniref:N-acetylmuramoyl-L-alanine amidase n=1 Tax=Rossellomorea aquimaris TaxID=189382 RepID=UPI000695B96C|nr:N-acetylmuramoyl-L-alanine amidase [Rossellomorea aquimaris]
MKTLMIDPGHGGLDPGANYRGHEEKVFNLLTARLVQNYLMENYNVNIIMTRTTDKTLSLSERSTLANLSKPDFFLSIHHNAGGGSGFESYVYSGSIPSQTFIYQNIIHDAIMTAIKPFNVVDRGKKRDNFHVLRETSMPSLLVEILFVDNPRDIALLNNVDFRNAVAAALARGIARALELPPKSDKESLFKVIAGSFTERKNAESRVIELKRNSIESIIDTLRGSDTTYYRVQTGAFSNRVNAESQVAKLKTLGIDSFISVEDVRTNSILTQQEEAE